MLALYRRLNPEFVLPGEVAIMNPYLDPAAWQLTERFYRKFYNDHYPRLLLFGINPGRFGGGITGIPFTDPVRLEADCGIRNDLPRKSELSSAFMYQMMGSLGGVAAFYGRFLFTALSPLGFTMGGKNLNYYDRPDLLEAARPFIIRNVRAHVEIPGVTQSRCICIGEGKNLDFFRKLNEQEDFFPEILSLPHPRWIMQYRRKSLDEYIRLYADTLMKAAEK